MGIALGYAFLVAIAGGLIAICIAQYLDMVEENRREAARDHDAGDRLLYGAPSIVPTEASLRTFSVPASAARLSVASK